MKENYSAKEVVSLLEQAEKLNIQLYSENTLNDIEVLIKQELLKFVGKPEKYE